MQSHHHKDKETESLSQTLDTLDRRDKQVMCGAQKLRIISPAHKGLHVTPAHRSTADALTGDGVMVGMRDFRI
jgi:hypothetical protein